MHGLFLKTRNRKKKRNLGCSVYIVHSYWWNSSAVNWHCLKTLTDTLVIASEQFQAVVSYSVFCINYSQKETQKNVVMHMKPKKVMICAFCSERFPWIFIFITSLIMIILNCDFESLKILNLAQIKVTCMLKIIQCSLLGWSMGRSQCQPKLSSPSICP